LINSAGWEQHKNSAPCENVFIFRVETASDDFFKTGKVQDGVVYRGISPDVLMIDRRGRLQVGSSGDSSLGVAYFLSLSSVFVCNRFVL
jgi:hypothetical protein